MVDETLDRILMEIRANVNCECVYVFGSRGRGTAQEGKSDYDVLVVASLRSILGSVVRIPSLRRVIDASSPVPVEVTFLASNLVTRYRDALPLMAWSLSAKLVQGRRDILRDLRVGAFAPDEMSSVYLSCHKAKWFLRFIRMDGNLNVSIEQEGLNKLSRLLDEDIQLGAGSLKGLRELASIASAEATRNNCDPATLCRSYADFLEGASERFARGDPRSTLSYLGLTASSLAEMIRFRTLAFPRGRNSQFRMVSALICFFRSMETKPPRIDLLRKASSLLNASFTTGSSPPEPKSDDNYPLALWTQVRSRLRGGEWDTLMNYPFGILVLHHPFSVILA